MLEWRTTTIEDCEQLSQTINHTDAQELYDATGLNPYQGLVMCVKLCPDCETAINEHNEVLAIRGVQKLNTHGMVWAILTKQAYTKAGFKQAMQETKQWVVNKTEQYKKLMNFVSEENQSAVRWLKYIGFSITKKIDHYGYSKKPFLQFERVL
ncbi:MAG: hypothetical protein CBC91_06170 [Rickettsiales bacterium TMED131]|nr:MAG: hypothetical protein CBC91_06170 [Rickettsiales bacterium TMED131]|tara:strand:- start:524 stop:982 length:459 start_codon:yes stop_codon:yes gene_type:complete